MTLRKLLQGIMDLSIHPAVAYHASKMLVGFLTLVAIGLVLWGLVWFVTHFVAFTIVLVLVLIALGIMYWIGSMFFD